MSSCANRSPEENEAFFEDGLAKLKSGEMEESTGKLIMDLMEIHDDKILVTFARQWIKLFPNQESAPRLVGKWLAKFGSNDALYLATNYVKTYPDVNALILIVRAAAQLPRIPDRLFAAIERRFDVEPSSHVWASLHGYENQCPKRDKLLLRWIERNIANTSVDIDMSSLALFTESQDVLEEIFRWTKRNQGDTENIWMLFSHLMRGQSQAHKTMLPRVAALAREWLAMYPEFEHNGRIYNDLLILMRSEDDIRSAKEWYREHADSPSADMALNGILTAAHRRGDPQEPEFVVHVKKVLSKQSPMDRIPVLAGALLKATPDEESIKLARETWQYYQHLMWLHADLLRLAPDPELVSKANEALATVSMEKPDVIIEMLKIDPTNDVAKQAAKRWLRKYPDNEQVKAVKELLAEKSNGKQ